MIQSVRCKLHPEEKYLHDDFITKKRCMGESMLVAIPDSLVHKCECGKKYEDAWLAGFCLFLHHKAALPGKGE